MTPLPQTTQVHYIDTVEAFSGLCMYLDKYIGTTSPMLDLDLEHSSLDPFTGIVWLCALRVHGAGPVYVVNMVTCFEHFAALKGVIERSVVVGANLSNDFKWLRYLWDIRPRRCYDVVIAERVLSAGTRSSGHALADLVMQYCNKSLDKTITSEFIVDQAIVNSMRAGQRPYPQWQKRHVLYTAEDVLYLPRIVSAQLIRFAAEDMELVELVENALVPVVSDMEYEGMTMNTELWQELADISADYREKMRVETVKLLAYKGARQSVLADDPDNAVMINLDSIPEVIAAFTSAGHKITSTQESVLKRVTHPAAKSLLEYKTAAKRCSAYGESWIERVHPVTKRLHTHFNQVRARSGRYSSTDPPFQTIPTLVLDTSNGPQSYRDAFVAEEGFKLIVADYSQIELRILAEFSGDANMIDILRSGQDIHSMTAALMYGVDISECGHGSDYRKRGKTINFAQIYGQGLEELAKMLGVTKEEAAETRNLYFAQFPGINTYLRRMGDMPFKTGYSKTALGRKRKYYGWNSSDLGGDERFLIRNTARNHPIQGTSVDITKMAQIRFADRIVSEPSWHLPWSPGIRSCDLVRQVNVVHDEIIAESVDLHSVLPAASAALQEDMVSAGEVFLKEVPVVVEVKISDHWVK